MNGIINLLKPPGLSSARAVSHIKRLTGEKVGHAGTLDPEACGVLPIMVGKATKLFDYLAEGEKCYVAVIAFGAATDTQDATGRIIATGGSYPDLDSLSSVLPDFTGDIMQRPPAYSAIKREGEALYKAARQGRLIETEPRPTTVHAIDLLGRAGEGAFCLRIRCGKGTYIRTLCHDIGQALGCPAHMRLLIREETAGFVIADAISLEAFEAAVLEGQSSGPWLRSMADCLSHLPQLVAPKALWRQCVNGVALDSSQIAGADQLAESQAALLFCDQQLMGIYSRSVGRLAVRSLLYEP